MSQLDPNQHVVTDCEFLRYCQRELREPALMSFYIPAEGRWVIGIWRNKDNGDVAEIDSWGPEGPSKDTFLTVKFNLKPEVKARGIRKWLAAQKDATQRLAKQREEIRAKRKDFAEFLRRGTNNVVRDDPTWAHYGVGRKI